jgi:hypothetical protein
MRRSGEKQYNQYTDYVGLPHRFAKQQENPQALDDDVRMEPQSCCDKHGRWATIGAVIGSAQPDIRRLIDARCECSATETCLQR